MSDDLNCNCWARPAHQWAVFRASWARFLRHNLVRLRLKLLLSVLEYRWRGRDRSFDGQCIGSRTWPSARAPSGSWCGFAARHCINHNLKGLWLWHEVGDDGARPA